MLLSQKVGMKLKLFEGTLHSRHLCYASLESKMIILRHITCYKALSYTHCEQQCSESCWPFAHLRLILILWLPTFHLVDTGHVTSHTSSSHYYHATLKSWEWPWGRDYNIIYIVGYKQLLHFKLSFRIITVPQAKSRSSSIMTNTHRSLVRLGQSRMTLGLLREYPVSDNTAHLHCTTATHAQVHGTLVRMRKGGIVLITSL